MILMEGCEEVKDGCKATFSPYTMGISLKGRKAENEEEAVKAGKIF